MFVPDIELIKISDFEAGCEQNEFTKPTGNRIDLRENHLTLVNRKILAELIIEAIEQRTIENFTYDNFAKDIIKPIKNNQDYKHYVSLGILEERIIEDNNFVK